MKIEKTVFISYRRVDGYIAKLVFHHLTSLDFDVFLDSFNIDSGSFERAILTQIAARAHFVIILTPNALERCLEPNDWLRREIEHALELKRNVVPLMFDSFSFEECQQFLTGKLALLQEYNGISVPDDFFDEAIDKLTDRFLNKPLDVILHPIPKDQKITSVSEPKPTGNGDSLSEVTLTLPIGIRDFDRHNLIDLLSGQLGISSEQIKILQVVEGSTIVTIVLPTKAAWRLSRIIRDKHQLLETGGSQSAEVSLDKSVILSQQHHQELPMATSEIAPEQARSASRTDFNRLSVRQIEILAYISDYVRDNGFPPTIREIGEATDINSTSVVSYNLDKLTQAGYIERSSQGSRGIRIIADVPDNTGKKTAIFNPEGQTVQIPLVGQIVAGEPVPAFEARGDTIEVTSSLLGDANPDEVFALTVKGDSMIDAMIADGDIVLLVRTDEARNGDLVSVWLEEKRETTLKRFYLEGSQIRLQPENPNIEPIFVDPQYCQILGKVISVIRPYIQ